MIKLAIFILTAGSVGLFVNELYPVSSLWLGRQHKKRTDDTSAKLEDMFMDVPERKIAILYLAAPIILGGAGLFLSHKIIIALGCAAVGLVVPAIMVKIIAQRRKQTFEKQLVDVLMVLSGSLKAGLSLLQSIEALVEEMAGPVGQEFGLVVRQVRMGVPFEEALLNLKRRMQLEDLDLIVTAILVARETGGELTETFTQLIFTIREKSKLIGRVKALCIQAKIQGIIMGILPIAFAVFAFHFNPTFFDILLKDKMGQMILTYAVISEIIGLFLIRIFSKVEV